MTDPRGNTTTYGYNAAGRQTSITDPLGGKVTIGYDLAGQKTSVVNPRGDTMAFTYDSLGDDARDIAKSMSFDLARPTGWLASVIELRNKR